MPNIDSCRERILSEDYRDFITGQFDEQIFSKLSAEERCEQNVGFLYRSIYVDKEIADPIDFGKYPYNSVPNCYTLIGTESLFQAGILQIQNYPNLELMGDGVMIGFVDTGIDYENTVFRNLDGSTRIAGIWDQTIQDGRPPEGFFYGTEYTQEDIDAALEEQEPKTMVPTTDTNGHGTVLASVAAGSADETNQFLGAAPEATIAVVKLKPAKRYLRDFYLIKEDAQCYQENDIMLGIQYLLNLAEERQMPLVLCVAIGTNLGSHDGTSPLAGMLEIVANTTNRALVIGGGNEANQRHHYYGKAENINDIKEVEIRVGDDVGGFCVELWTDIPNLMAVSVQSPSGERIEQVSIRRNTTEVYDFILDGTRLTLNYIVLVENSNAELVFMRFDRPVAGNWKIFVTPLLLAQGVFHMWLPVTEFLDNDVYFLEPNPDYTITEPGNIISGITTAYYNGNENSIAIQSGRGYTKSNRVKPDLAAPGVDVDGVAQNNRSVIRSGSSIAAGITAGAAALLMEWIVYRLGRQMPDAMQIRNLLILGAEKRPDEEYPNREWGYGKLNLYNTFDVLRRI